jgi:hypothetical protein
MNKTLLLIGGLGLGAGLMYILDSEQGERRRAQLREQAAAYRRRSDQLLGQTQRTLRRQARGLLAQAHTPLSRQRWAGKIQPLYSARQRSTPGLLMLGCVGLGAGLMYILDPTAGRRRRALIRDKANSYWRSTESFVEKTARDAGNRTRGLMAEARTRLSGAAVPSDALLESRVRAQIGHVIANAGAIGVAAHRGCVSLSGPIAADEEQKLLATVKSVPGVTEMVNQLEVHDDTKHISGLQGHHTAR